LGDSLEGDDVEGQKMETTCLTDELGISVPLLVLLGLSGYIGRCYCYLCVLLLCLNK
jgi:hypothetical protein